MQRHLSKLCLSILALAMLIIAPLASAQAADGWQPKFDVLKCQQECMLS